MFKLLGQCGRLAAVISLIGLAGCAIHRTDISSGNGGSDLPTPPDPPVQGTSFQMDEQGMLVPVNEDGEPFVSCGTLEKNNCSLFRDSIRLESLTPTMIIGVDYEVNPKCKVFVMVFQNKSRIFYDKNDPNCANLHD